MSRDRSCKRLMKVSLAFLILGALCAGFGCGDKPTTDTTAAPNRANVQTPTTKSNTTNATAMDVTSSDATASALADPGVQKVLDQLQEAARRTSFTAYYLGAACGPATIAGVMAGNTDAYGAPQLVDIVYRHDGLRDRLVVYLSQYDPGLRLDLKKPLSDWTLVREVDANGYIDVIYYAPSPADALFYVAKRGSTEISLTGYTNAGYLTEEQLIDVGALLVPVLQSSPK